MRTLVESLERHASAIPDRGYTFLDGDYRAETLAFAALRNAAARIGAALQSLGATGERVLIACPHDLSYVKAVCGSFYAGATTVPAFPPRRRRHLSRILSIITDCAPTVAITSAADLTWIGSNAPDLLTVCRWIAIEELERESEAAWAPQIARPDDVAVLQYTSGSTSQPKGVMVTHANIFANCEMLDVYAMADDVIVGWLPFFHDMGLVGGILKPIDTGIETVFFAPAQFLSTPLFWLKALSDYRATVSGGPNLLTHRS